MPSVGDVVRITGGPDRGWLAKVVEVHPSQERFWLRQCVPIRGDGPGTPRSEGFWHDASVLAPVTRAEHEAAARAHGEAMDRDERCTFSGSRNEDGERHGPGLWTHEDGRRYDGGWADGRRHGQGRFDYADGTWYEGGYRHGLREGHGTFEAADARYEGAWREGKMHGAGRYALRAEGLEYEGVWADGRMGGYGVVRYGEGRVYEGGLQDGRRHGYGRLVAHGRVLYEGEWREGRPCSWNAHRLRRACRRYCFFVPQLAAVVLLSGVLLTLFVPSLV